MKALYLLVSYAVLTSGSPHYREIFFPGDEGNDVDENDTDDSYDYENFGEDEYDDPYSELESFGFEGDYVELPEWMDTDLNELSLDKLAFLNNVTEFTELSGFFELDLDAFLQLPNRTQPELGIDSRSGNSTLPVGKNLVEKKGETAKFAKCNPEKVTVKLPVPKNTLYMPSCVRLKRCGGCCNSKLLSCQPTKVEEVSLTVLKISKCSSKRRRSVGGCGSRRRSRRRRTSGQKVTMPMENHVKCKCDCKVQEKDCNPGLHNYNQAGCSCECKNGDEEMECQKSSALHEWDKKLCSCMCRKKKECSTGEEFSQKTCRCVTANGDV